jgi:hypothetical protein
MDASNRLDPQRAALMGRVGGYARWAREPDRPAATAPARAGLLARFEREVLADAAERGVELTRAQIAERVEARRLEQLARARLARHDRRRSHRARPGRAMTQVSHAAGDADG